MPLRGALRRSFRLRRRQAQNIFNLVDRKSKGFYFDSLKGKGFSFSELTRSVKRRFITAEYERTLVREWDSLTLNAVMAENSGKSGKYCLEEPVSRMHPLHSGLPSTYCNDEVFKNKLLNAVKDVEASRLAFFKPAERVECLISDLHSSLAIEPTRQQSSSLDAHFATRCFKGQRSTLTFETGRYVQWT